MKPDVFGARASLSTAQGSFTIYRLDALPQGRPRSGPGADAVLDPRAPGSGPPQRGRRAGDGRRRQEPRGLERGGAQGRRASLHAGPGDPPGLHGRARGRRPGLDARRREAAGRRPDEDQSPRARGPGRRPLGPGRRVRLGRRAGPERRRSSSSATASATSSCAGARRRSRTSGWCRPPPGSSTR